MMLADSITSLLCGVVEIAAPPLKHVYFAVSHVFHIYKMAASINKIWVHFGSPLTCMYFCNVNSV